MLSKLYTLCYSGERLRIECFYFAESTYNVNRYKYPVKIQHLIKLVIFYLQNPFIFTAMGLINCNMEL